MALSPNENLKTSNNVRHVGSVKTQPSDAGYISHLNAVILGEALASEEIDLIFPSDEFSRQAHVPSLEKVSVCLSVSLAVLGIDFLCFTLI